jgi:uncharacterized protein YbaR (Trm112 family)
MTFDRRLLQILACPQDHGPLVFFASESMLYNPRLRRRYRVDGHVPVLLIEEGQTVPIEEHERLMSRLAQPPSGLR